MTRDLSSYTNQDILAVIVKHTHMHHGLTPTRRQLIEILDLTAQTTSPITHRLERMVEEGLLFWNGARGARRIGVVGGYWVYYPWFKIAEEHATHREQMEYFARSATPLAAVPVVFEHIDGVEGREGAVQIIDIMLRKILGSKENYRIVIETYEADTGKKWETGFPRTRDGEPLPLPNIDLIFD